MPLISKTAGYLKNRLKGAIAAEEFSPETPVQIVTEDHVVYSIREVEYEPRSDKDPEQYQQAHPHGILWLKVEEEA